MDTFNLPWEELLLHYYEGSMDNMSYNDVFDLAVNEYLPEFVNQAEEEDSEFARGLLKEQKATVKAKQLRDKQKAALESATQQLASNASKIVEKAQSISKALDKQRATLPKPKAMSLKFDDEGDPENF